MWFFIALSVWLFIPVLFAPPMVLDEFREIYPNKYKHLLVLFLFGPSVWIVLGIQLIFPIFEKYFRFERFRDWLKK